ncbi:MAG: iron-sulfur cluster repair di-iron protein [Bacteroidetes bacterium]|nr:iron-sulfur cluster repair di-iron protein [Bacteroidota bacterium]
METLVAHDGIQQSLSEIVLRNPAARAIFDKYNLDYCCGGQQALADAAVTLGLEPETIWSEIESLPVASDAMALRYHDWTMSLLIDFIEQNYHQYVRKSIPLLSELLSKVAAVHSEQHPELLSIQSEFEVLASDLLSHMKKEELVLFPALRELEQTGGQTDHPIAVMIEHPIAAMQHEHDIAGDLLKSIREYSNHYQVPADGCVTYQLTFQKLEEFDRELVNHIHLENNVLFKKKY